MTDGVQRVVGMGTLVIKEMSFDFLNRFLTYDQLNEGEERKEKRGVDSIQKGRRG